MTGLVVLLLDILQQSSSLNTPPIVGKIGLRARYDVGRKGFGLSFASFSLRLHVAFPNSKNAYGVDFCFDF